MTGFKEADVQFNATSSIPGALRCVRATDFKQGSRDFKDAANGVRDRLMPSIVGIMASLIVAFVLK